MGKRIEVLLEWRDVVVAAGHPAPTVADMMRIGAAGEVRPQGVDLDAVEPWADAIGHLLRLLKDGVTAPVSRIPDDLMVPAPAARRTASAGAPAGSGSRDGDDSVLTALRTWWQAGQATEPALHGLKEHHLRNIATTGSRTEAEVRRHLPAPLAHYAPRIVEVVARTAGTPGPAGAAPAGTPSAGTSSTHPHPSTDSPAPSRAAPRPTPQPPVGRHAAPGPSPRPTAAAEPGRSGPEADPGRTGPDAELAELELADYEFSPAPGEPAIVRKRPGPKGTVLTWPAADVGAATVLYRVISADGRYGPDRPQGAALVTVTESLRCVDDRPFRFAARHVQVWVHAGRTREEAAAAEPVKHAECVVVAPVTDARIREDGPSIVGQWRVPPGVTEVEVLRVPEEHARLDGHSDPEFRLRPPRPFTTGFVDDGVEPGRRYVYELSVVVDVDGRQVLSAPTKVPVEVSAVLSPVTDLRVEEQDDAPVLDLSWTRPPGGTVRIYRTSQPPVAGLDERPQPVSVLPDGRLTDDDELGRPFEHHGDGRSTMAGVPWPKGWTFAYLTPVTVLGDMAAIGPSTLVIRLRQVQEARIVERTHWQILTFAWPDGADSVLAYLGGPDQSAEDARRSRPEEISQEQYVAQGGMYFRTRLSRRGCSVHLEPVAYHAGRQVAGPITSLHYPGLLQLGYDVHVDRDKANRPVAVRLRIYAETELGQSPPFTLVFNPDRFPLHERDGRPLDMRSHGDPQPVAGRQFRPSGLSPNPGEVSWHARVDGLVGYLRLFACLPPEARSTVALFDPPIEQLYLAAPRAGS